jgi:hypothetical protein
VTGLTRSLLSGSASCDQLLTCPSLRAPTLYRRPDTTGAALGGRKSWLSRDRDWSSRDLGWRRHQPQQPAAAGARGELRDVLGHGQAHWRLRSTVARCPAKAGTERGGQGRGGPVRQHCPRWPRRPSSLHREQAAARNAGGDPGRSPDHRFLVHAPGNNNPSERTGSSRSAGDNGKVA